MSAKPPISDANKSVNRSPLAIIFMTIFLDLLGFGIILPQLPFYALKFGASATMVGILGGVFSGMQFLFAPAWGVLSDRIGRRPVILIGVLGTAISMTMLAFTNSLWMLLVARVLAGVSGANLAAAQAYISDVTTPENRAKGMGLVGAAFGLGFIFGPAIGGVLGDYSEHAPGLFAATLAGLNFVAGYFLLPESHPKERRGQRALSLSPLQGIRGLGHPKVGPLFWVSLVFTLAFANLEGTFAMLTHVRLGFDSRHVGYVFAYIGVLGAVLQGVLMGRLVKRFGEMTLLRTGAFLLALGLLGTGEVVSVWMLLATVPLVSIGNGLMTPSLSSLVSQSCEPHERGSVIGMQQSLSALSRMLGPAMGGFLFEHFSPAMPYRVAAALLVLVVLLVMRLPALAAAPSASKGK